MATEHVKTNIILLRVEAKFGPVRPSISSTLSKSMSKPRRQGFGKSSEQIFSNSTKKHNPSAETTKEKQALVLINEEAK